MADQEFEEFRDGLDDLPQHFTTPVQTYKLVHAITPIEENKSFLEKLQTGEKMWSNMHDEGSESLFTSWSSDTTGGTGAKMGALFQDSNQADLVLTEGDDSGFCKSITSMSSSVSSAVPVGTSILASAKAFSDKQPSGIWSSSSEGEEDEDVFDKRKTTSDEALISTVPIKWDDNSKTGEDKNKPPPRPKLLPSFTKCGSIDDDLPPPPILRPSNYNKKQHEKVVNSGDKTSNLNGAHGLSKRRRKQKAAVISQDVLSKVRLSNKAKKEVERSVIHRGQTEETSYQKHRLSAKKVLSNSSTLDDKVTSTKKEHKKYPQLQSPEISLLQELKDATNNSAAIINAAQGLSTMTLSSEHPSLPSTFCLLTSCDKHKQNIFDKLRATEPKDVDEKDSIVPHSMDIDLCLYDIEKATHDLDLSDTDEKIACHIGISGTVDVDSGNSSTHSPSPMDPYQSIHSPSGQKQRASPTKCTSPTHREIDEYSKIKSPSLSDGNCNSTPSSTPPSANYFSPDELDLLDPTHRGLHKFIPRHLDEIEIDIGDPIYVQKEADDLWCEGANLRTGCQGIFPLAHVVDIEYNEFDPSNHGGCLNAGGMMGRPGDGRKERYLLNYLGSIESSLYKGNVVLCQAVRKIVSSKQKPNPHPTVLEISDKGIKIVDKSKFNVSTAPCHDYFYSLKNVTFCGFHPRQPKYFGFVSKHPTLPKYACHVFVGDRSTQHVAEGCGRAFQRFYQKFIETAFPVEDIYLE